MAAGAAAAQQQVCCLPRHVAAKRRSAEPLQASDSTAAGIAPRATLRDRELIVALVMADSACMPAPRSGTPHACQSPACPRALLQQHSGACAAAEQEICTHVVSSAYDVIASTRLTKLAESLQRIRRLQQHCIRRSSVASGCSASCMRRISCDWMMIGRPEATHLWQCRNRVVSPQSNLGMILSNKLQSSWGA
jgi:hypothetical protein